jgi:anti-anti-sigma regulatory factor
VFAGLPVIENRVDPRVAPEIFEPTARALYREGARMFWAVQSDERRICLLGLEGSLSSDDLVNLTERLRGLAVQGVLRVVIDLRRVDHWDFRGLRCLAEGVEYRRSCGGVTAFVSSSRYLRDIASVAGVLDRLDFYDDMCLEEGSDLRAPKVLELVEEPRLRGAMGEGP